MPTLFIYGDGGFGREMLVALRGLTELPGEIAFIDDASTATRHDGVPVMRFADARPGDYYLLAIQNSHVRQSLEAKCDAAGLLPYSLTAPYAIVGPQVDIGPGALLYLRSTITGFSRIGRQFQLSLQSYIGHDCIIGDYVTFGPGVGCCGNVHIGDHVFIGAEVTIKNGTPKNPLVIGEGAVIGLGAVVTKDVPAGMTVVGHPAQPVAPA